MALSRRRGNGLDAWPGYVDALSTLLMVIIFVLLVFVLAQAFLSVALSGRDQALARLKGELAALTQTLSAERSRGAEQDASIGQLQRQLTQATTAKTQDDADLARLRSDLAASQAAQAAARTAREQEAAAQSDATLRADSAMERLKQVQAQIATLGQRDDAALSAAQDQVTALRNQIAKLMAALQIADKAGSDKDARITELDARLNAALATKVQELQRYRSEFFGRLRDVLAKQNGVRVVGDRFVFQSEVLFPAGSADLSGPGQQQLQTLATTLMRIAGEIPKDLPWVLRVDGHADRQKVTHDFASNWELSAQRAINVVKQLVQDGVPATRLAAVAFGDKQPLDTGDSQAAYARNRRIEFRLTDR